MEKRVLVIGGVGEECAFGSQYRQQYRVLDSRKASYAMNAGIVIPLVVKKWKKEK